MKWYELQTECDGEWVTICDGAHPIKTTKLDDVLEAAKHMARATGREARIIRKVEFVYDTIPANYGKQKGE